MSVSYQTITTKAADSYTITVPNNFDSCATKTNSPQTLGPISHDMPLVTFKYKNDLVGIRKDNKCYILNDDTNDCALYLYEYYEPLPDGHIFLINEQILNPSALAHGTVIVHKETGKIYFFNIKTKSGNFILLNTETGVQELVSLTTLCNDYFQVINLKTAAMERNLIRLGAKHFLLPLLSNSQLERYKACDSHSVRYLYVDYLYKREQNIKGAN